MRTLTTERARTVPIRGLRLGVSIAVSACLMAGVLLVSGGSLATPWTGAEPSPTNLLFHLHNSSSGVTVGAVKYLNVLDTVNDLQAPWTSSGALSVAMHYDAVQFVVAPELTAALTINGTVNATVYMNQSGSAPTGGTISVAVDQVAPSGAVTLIGTGPGNPTSAIGPGGSIPTAVFLKGPTVSATIPGGDSLQVNITISGNTAESYGIWWGLVKGTHYVSTVSVPASTYLTVPKVTVLNATGQPITVLSTSIANQTVTVVGLVADPLGAYDFENFSVDFSVLSAIGAVVVSPVRMAPVPGLAPPGAPNGTYHISYNYSALPTGTYNFTVNATDNTNHNLAGQNTLPTYFGRNAFGRVMVAVGLPPVAVHLSVVDDHNVSLAGAPVQAISAGVSVAAGKTNTTGVVTFALAGGGAYRFAVWWEGVAVGIFSESVPSAATTFVLHATVIYPTFQIVTAGGQPLPYALVTAIHPNGTAYRLIVGNSSGEFSLKQVPAGNYTLTVVYDDSEVVSAQPVFAATDGPIPVIAATVFSLTVQATTAAGEALANVVVAIMNATTGATVASGITGASGTLTFLVPAGSYVVTGDWASTYYLTAIRQTVTTTVAVTGPATAALKFTQAYPAFTSTNEFFLILGYGVLTALLVALVVLVIRRGRRAPPMRTTGSSTLPEVTKTSPPGTSSEPPGSPGAGSDGALPRAERSGALA